MLEQLAGRLEPAERVDQEQQPYGILIRSTFVALSGRLYAGLMLLLAGLMHWSGD